MTQAPVCSFSLSPFRATDDFPAHKSILLQGSADFKKKIADPTIEYRLKSS
jgi:hypothetical protein